MAIKSSEKPVSTGSRRSARLSNTPKPPSTKADTNTANKRASAGGEGSAASAKKAKVDEVKESAAAKEEKKAEAPKEAKAETTSGTGGVLKLGDKLPSITLKTNEGKEVDVSGLAATKGVVLFLYPKANTPGCTTQACGYRDIHADIAAQGYEVYGLSKDTPTSQQNWIDKKELNYKLLCDPSSNLIKRLGAFVPPGSTKRSHFIFEKGSGKLVDSKLGVKPADDPENCLQFIKQHHK